MADDTTNSLFGAAGDPQAAGRLIQALSARNAGAMRAGLDQQLRAAQEGLASWTQDFTQQMNVAETAMNSFKATSSTMFTGLASGMTRSISNATTYSKSIGEAQAANWLTSVINTGVEQYGARLVASHTKHSAPAGR